ncbi:uncharacterized protein [Typha latifolia]|uniref:uncharacterized protein n=1 Tax=Typha latifolia TaxID=4733 RepID=UPI003C2BA532
MKGRSHRLPASDPPDDWGDGSWTVDCSCGVTFDDGEEMVSCDECGVWVHTRCARFVKDDPSFACHNCKAAARRLHIASAADDDDAEETEVAQLLVELPTKTGPTFRRWAEVPLEDRVHVHGAPGGDPAVFQGLSSVFTADLWRCTGYVPKKLNLRYREFPAWDRGEKEEEGESNASRGADVLFALSKETVSPPTFGAGKIWEPGFVRKKEGGNRPGKKERNRSKRRKEEYGEGKKKTSGDSKRRGSNPIIDMNKSGFRTDRDLQVGESVVPNVKYEDRKVELLEEPDSSGQEEGSGFADADRYIKAEKNSAEGQKIAVEMPMKVEKVDTMATVKTEISSRTDAALKEKVPDVPAESLIVEVLTKALHGSKQPKDEHHFEGSHGGGQCSKIMISENLKPSISNVRGSQDLLDVPMDPDSNVSISLSLKVDKVAMKLESGDHQSTTGMKCPASPFIDGKVDGLDHLPLNQQHSLCQLSENLQNHNGITSLPSGEPKVQEMKSEAIYQVCDRSIEGISSRDDEPRLLGQGIEDLAGSSTAQKSSLEWRHGSVPHDQPANPETQNLIHLMPDISKSILGVPKASSASYGPVFSRSSFSGLSRLGSTASSTAGKAAHLTKKQVRLSASAAGKNDSAKSTVSCEARLQEHIGQPVKCQPKGSTYSGHKPSQTSRSISSSSKHRLSDQKEQFSKSATTTNTTAMVCSGEGSPSQSQIKFVSSKSSQKNERIHQQVPQSSSEVVNSSMPLSLHTSDVVTNLSDEQLALLLHQQLNSSPRVPRVPRVRQAAGMQFGPPNAASVFSKRSSASGGRDQVSVFKKKNKEDASRDSSRSSRESNDELKKFGRVASSLDQKHQEAAISTDSSARKDSQNMSAGNVSSMQKNHIVSSTEDANSSVLSSSENSALKVSSIHSFQKDDPSNCNSPSPHTLPGLIDEIMCKNRDITYEELCDAVRPHWDDLRKPNGERYAYPSHLHAVHDCLRNRSEWAHLIDQAPKTNSSRKRRKLDSDAPFIGSEKEKDKSKASGEIEEKSAETQREDFPKGKRKARKRRRLELSGRGGKDAQKRQNRCSPSDDDPTTLSPSSNEGNENLFSDEDSQVSGQLAAGAESASSSSSDAD